MPTPFMCHDCDSPTMNDFGICDNCIEPTTADEFNKDIDKEKEMKKLKEYAKIKVKKQNVIYYHDTGDENDRL